jgi:hypothetical protein
MSTMTHRTLCVLAVGLLTTLTAPSTRAADCESDRIVQYYDRCYGPNGPYCVACDRCRRNAQAQCPEDNNACHHTCCYRCVTNFFGPGSTPPSRCLDICLYRAFFPISPWYSNPRDGIHYPAYGSKSPSCVPSNSY